VHVEAGKGRMYVRQGCARGSGEGGIGEEREIYESVCICESKGILGVAVDRCRPV
jgi:hypothetical protein